MCSVLLSCQLHVFQSMVEDVLEENGYYRWFWSIYSDGSALINPKNSAQMKFPQKQHW